MQSAQEPFRPLNPKDVAHSLRSCDNSLAKPRCGRKQIRRLLRHFRRQLNTGGRCHRRTVQKDVGGPDREALHRIQTEKPDAGGPVTIHSGAHVEFLAEISGTDGSQAGRTASLPNGVMPPHPWPPKVLRRNLSGNNRCTASTATGQ